MTLDILSLLRDRQNQNLELHSEHLNPQFARVLKTIGFDRSYVRGEGPYLYDAEGRRTVDFLSGYGVFNMGRNHPAVRKALEDFLGAEHASLVQMEAPLLSGLLAEALKARCPDSLERVFFTNSGAEGIETAIKFARRATGRPRLLHCEHSFHGLTTGALALNGEAWFREGFDPLLSATEIPLNDTDALERELSKGDVAAFVIEPIQGKTVHVADDDYLRAASELCLRHGTLLVLDEVQCGLGRSGKLFAFEYSGIVPDILVIAKALSGGYVPVGAVLTRREIHDTVFSSMDRSVVHSSTFGQNALAMVAGLASLQVIDDEHLTERAAKLGARLLSGLKELGERYEFIRDVRGRGLMIGIEFGRPHSLKLKVAWDVVNKVNKSLFCQAIVIPLLSDHNILTQVAGRDTPIIKLIPPLVISEEDVDHFLEAFDDVVRRAHRFPGPIWEVTSRLAKFAMRRKS